MVTGPRVGTMDWKIELIPVPVTDVDRAKAFYEKVGFHADHDHRVHDSLRFVQLTPPGSACSIVIGEGITDKTPGTQEIQVVVADAEAARRQLLNAADLAAEAARFSGQVGRLDRADYVAVDDDFARRHVGGDDVPVVDAQLAPDFQ